MTTLGAPKLSPSPRSALSESQEDYLKQILLLGTQGLPETLEGAQAVSTQALAEQIGVRPASVTGMLKKLSELNLVHYEAYKGATLTEQGHCVAVEVLRHHRLIEAYLHQALGYNCEEVHAEAEKLEHHISEAFEQRIAQWLGHPTQDPHGQPIPNAQLQFDQVKSVAPSTFKDLCHAIGSVMVTSIRGLDQDAVNTLKKLGVVPSARLLVLDSTPLGVRIQLDQERLWLDCTLAALVQVEASHAAL